MYKFIFGDAGSGKSAYIYQTISAEAVREPHRRYFLFVPEQNTLHAQQEIIRAGERHGMLNLDVLSFQLLAYRVMEELGINTPVLLDDVSKSILIRKAALDCAAKLQVYRSKLDAPGFIDQVRKMVTEFYQYSVSPDQLRLTEEKAAGKLLKGKLSDIRLIYERFRELLSGEISIPEEMPVLLLRNMAASHLLDDAVIVFDGFTGFTPVQIKLLEHILTKAAEVRFSVTIPAEASPYRRTAGKAGIPDLYWLSRETVAKVSEAAERNGVRKGEDIVLERRKAPPAVRICQAEDPVDEIRYIVNSISRNAVRGGQRYRRMAVAVSDLASYGEILKREMSRAGIPWFMDAQTDALGSPAVELVRAALAAVTGGYRYEDVMRYLRNPLMTLNPEVRDRTDLFDNVIRARGIRGRAAVESALSEADLSMEPVFRLHDALREAPSLGEKTKALGMFLENAELETRVENLASRLDGADMAREAGEIRRVAGQIPLLFARLTAVLGTEKISMRDFERLTEAGFSDMKTGIIPAGMDMLQIGDLKRSRFDDIDILYIAGANDGLLPSAVTGGGLFTDREREEMERAELELAPDDKTDSCIQLFYLYMIMNKPRRELVITYAGEGRDGRGRKPSEVIDELRAGHYHGFAAADFARTDLASRIPVSKEDALAQFAQLVSTASAGNRRLKELYRVLKEDPETAEQAEMILQGAFRKHVPERLLPENAARLYTDRLYGSVTRIESFEGCPFSHFLRYGLRLKKRQEFDIEALDIGNLYHQSLDLTFRRVAERGQEVTSLEDSELNRICRESVDTVLGEYHDRIMESSARSRYIAGKVRKITERTLWALKQQLMKGDFSTLGTEVPFRYREGYLDLHGVIDRVDCCREESKVYVKVIDYKSGSARFDLHLAVNGLQLQLVTYMDMALQKVKDRFGEEAEAVPAGMFYYHIEDPVLDYDRSDTDADTDDRRLDALKMNGVVPDAAGLLQKLDRTVPAGKAQITSTDLRKSAVVSSRGACILSEEDFGSLIRITRNRMQEDAERIMSGDIEIKPFEGSGRRQCDYCEYHSICGFSADVPGFTYRKLPPKEKGGGVNG